MLWCVDKLWSCRDWEFEKEAQAVSNNRDAIGGAFQLYTDENYNAVNIWVAVKWYTFAIDSDRPGDANWSTSFGTIEGLPVV